MDYRIPVPHVWWLYFHPYWFYCLKYVFFNFWACNLDLWPFDLIFSDGRGLVMDYPCAKFGDCIFSHFGFIVRKNTQTQRDREKPLIALLRRLPSAWVINYVQNVSNAYSVQCHSSDRCFTWFKVHDIQQTISQLQQLMNVQIKRSVASHYRAARRCVCRISHAAWPIG